jgi:hypothetical protein
MAAPNTSDRVNDHPDVTELTLQGVLEAVVDPVRRSIVRQLAHSPVDMACGTFAINVTRSTGTHHFRVLRHVEDERVAPRRPRPALPRPARRDHHGRRS